MSIFTSVQGTHQSSNTFDLSHDRKMSMSMGNLTPIHCQEIVPGDKITMSTSQMLRMSPMISPIMHKVKVFTHFYFVPNRILWDGWEDFITGGEDGQANRVFPTQTLPDDLEPGSIGDYLGLPTETYVENFQVSALPTAAYGLIYNEYYRDQNLIDPIDVSLIDGIQDGNLDFIQDQPFKRAWTHDYFTSALPWTQKGAEATIPLGTTADIGYKSGPYPQSTRVKDENGNFMTNYPDSEIGTDNSGNFQIVPSGSDPRELLNIDNSQNLYADLSSATAASINDLRRAFKLQEWLEKNARGGSRYIESILSHFGVRSSDARLQRPEFLGGSSSNMVISEVLQTSDAAAEQTPQGNMAGHGIAVGANNSFSYYAEEHGYIIGIMSIMPKPAYQQGLPKHFTKFDKFDYYWPSFAHLGEQPILNKEIYLANDGENDDVFGYTPRYAEYKFINSSVHGEMRTTLDFWHMGRIFENRPQLNEDFINCDPTSRIFAVTDSETIYCHIFHRIKAKRKMPYFGTPRL